MTPPFSESDPQPPLRVGAVNYLNSKPLVERLATLGSEGQKPELRLLFDLPSRLADSLAAGRLDVALIPVVEYLARPEYRIASDACVASRGPVRSVKVYFRQPPHAVRRLALDEGSRTSAALARVLLARRHGLRPELGPLPIGCDTRAVDADAVLMIGDRAMSPPAELFVAEWDLATEWRRWTGLPFVFACWVARPDVRVEPVAALLAAARDLGEQHLHEIAAAEGPKLGVSTELAVEYLCHNLHFRLGADERKSVERFRAECEQLGLFQAAVASKPH